MLSAILIIQTMLCISKYSLWTLYTKQKWKHYTFAYGQKMTEKVFFISIYFLCNKMANV